MKKPHYHPLLGSFIHQYLTLEKEKSNGLFIFRKKKSQAKAEEFLEELDAFLSEHPNSYQYPSEYI